MVFRILVPMMDEISQIRIQFISSWQVLESCPTVFSNFHVLLSWGELPSEYVRMNRNIIQCCILMWLVHAHRVYPSQWTTRFTFFLYYVAVVGVSKLHRNLPALQKRFTSKSDRRWLQIHFFLLSHTFTLITSSWSRRNTYLPRVRQKDVSNKL